jgi:hypothetical protein
MLADPLVVSYLDAAPDVFDDISLLTLRDLQLGKAVRSVVVPTGAVGTNVPVGVSTMTTSHSESRENKGQITDRSATRFEVRRTLDTGEASIAQATLTVSSPRLGFTPTEILDIVRLLVGTLCATRDSVAFANLARVIAGEP